MLVNHKQVMRMMAEENLLAEQPESFVITTNGDHEFGVIFEPGPPDKADRNWVADILHSFTAGICLLGTACARFAEQGESP